MLRTLSSSEVKGLVIGTLLFKSVRVQQALRSDIAAMRTEGVLRDFDRLFFHSDSDRTLSDQ
jgi:hypothetical protein